QSRFRGRPLRARDAALVRGQAGRGAALPGSPVRTAAPSAARACPPRERAPAHGAWRGRRAAPAPARGAGGQSRASGGARAARAPLRRRQGPMSVDPRSEKRTTVLVSAALALAVLLTYAEVGSFAFVRYDDPDYVLANPPVRSGLTWSGLC